MSAAAASSSAAVQQLLADREIAQRNKTEPTASAEVIADADAQLTEVAADLSALGYS